MLLYTYPEPARQASVPSIIQLNEPGFQSVFEKCPLTRDFPRFFRLPARPDDISGSLTSENVPPSGSLRSPLHEGLPRDTLGLRRAPDRCIHMAES